MIINNVLKDLYTLRSSFLKRITPLIKKNNISFDILDIYKEILNDIIKNDPNKDIYNDYFINEIDEKLSLSSPEKTSKFIYLLYGLLININNCYLFHLEQKGFDVSSFFSGFSLEETKLKKEELKEKLLDISENDIDMIELLDVDNAFDINYIFNKHYQDMYLIRLLLDLWFTKDSSDFNKFLSIALLTDKLFKDSVAYSVLSKIIKIAKM